MNNTLHIYASPCPHGDAFIVGDYEGLARLKDTIEYILQQRDDSARHLRSFDAFTNDGEGFTCRVALLPDGELEALSPVYTDEIERSDREVHPCQLRWQAH